MPRNTLSSLQAKIASLEADKVNLEAENKILQAAIETAAKLHLAEVEQQKANQETAEKERETEFALTKDELIQKFETTAEQLKEVQLKLDARELKKLASAYKEQEDEYSQDTSRWLIALIVVAGLLLTSTITLLVVTNNKPWSQKIDYWVVDLVFVSAVWFCGAQYTEYEKLRNEYANKKTIAQSFHNILGNLSEDEAIKERFIDKATDILCSPNPIRTREPVLSKKLAKDMAEIIGTAVKSAK